MNLALRTLLLTSLVLPAFAGTVGGGGGGTLPEKLVDPNYLSLEISRMKPFVEMAINYLDLVDLFTDISNTQPSEASIAIKKLKPHLQEMFDRVKKEGFTVLSQRACKDRNGKDVDASVADNEFPDKICISVKTLSTKLTYKNYFESSVGLLVHEATHLYGADEKEALVIQQLVGLFLTSNHRYGSLLMSFKKDVDDLTKQMEKLSSETQTSGEGFLCMQLSALATKYSNIRYMSAEPLPGGLSVIDGKAWEYFMLGTAQIHYASTFCLNVDSQEYKQVAMEAKDDTIPASRVNEKIFSGSSERIIVVQPGNRKLLKVALETAKQYLLVQKYQAERISELVLPQTGDLK